MTPKRARGQTDIVQRLRDGAVCDLGHDGPCDPPCLGCEAADTIERLRRLDVQFGQVEAWICMHTDFASPPHQDEAGAQGLIAALDRLKAERDALREICAEAYQVVGHLAHYAGVFDYPDTVRALDNLCAAADGEPIPHESVLPFSASPAPPETTG